MPDYAETAYDSDLEVELNAFLERFSFDDRAIEYLRQCPPEVQRKVVQNFAPKSQPDSDFSRRLTGYIRSVLATTEAEAASPAIDRDALAHDAELFRQRYPVDDRAWEYLLDSTPAVQAKIIAEFRPKNEGELDYSSLLTSFVKRMRSTCASLASAPAGARRDEACFPSSGQMEELQRFRDRYPMDDRAWEYLTSSPRATQDRVMSEFKPRRENDSDYSAAVTAFVKALASSRPQVSYYDSGRERDRRQMAPPKEQLQAFRETFPMDDRAYDFLENCPPAVQSEALRNFTPKPVADGDYSRPLTAYLKQLREQFGGSFGGGGGGGRSPDRRRGRSRSRSRSRSNRRSDRDRHGGSRSGRGGDWLRAFQVVYPIDTRALDYLQQAPREVQDQVFEKFRPRRSGDADYSGAVTSFLRSILRSNDARAPYAPRRRVDEPPPNLLEAFKLRYPMDDRAWDYLVQSPFSTQRTVLERFRPPREGERDYSGLITSFIKKSDRR